MDYKESYVSNSRPFFSVDDIRRVSQHVGNHFFDPPTMRFFNSRIASQEVFGDRLFITSEQFKSMDGTRAPRRYTVREITATGHVHTAHGFKFQEFDTLRQAKAAARAAAARKA